MKKIIVLVILLISLFEINTVIQGGGPPEIFDLEQEWAPFAQDPITALTDLIKQNSLLEEIEEHIKKYSVEELNRHNKDGYTPLHIATMKNKFSIVKTLLERGVNIDQLDSSNGFNNTALWFALIGKQEKIVNVLLEYGAILNYSTEHLLALYRLVGMNIHCLPTYCHFRGYELLTSERLSSIVCYDISSISEEKKAFLEYVLTRKCYSFRDETLKCILERESNHFIKIFGKFGYFNLPVYIGEQEIDVQAITGLSDVHWAFANNDEEKIESLMISDEDLQRKEQGKTPIDFSVQNSHYALAEKHSEGKYSPRYLPLHWALQKKEEKWIEHFADTKKEYIKRIDHHGNNALHKAAKIPGLDHFALLACHNNVSLQDMKIKNGKKEEKQLPDNQQPSLSNKKESKVKIAINKNPYELALINKCFTPLMQWPAQQLITHELGKLQKTAVFAPSRTYDEVKINQLGNPFVRYKALKALASGIPEVLCLIATHLVKDHFASTVSKNPHHKIRLALKDLRNLRLVCKSDYPMQDVRNVGRNML